MLKKSLSAEMGIHILKFWEIIEQNAYVQMDED